MLEGVQTDGRCRFPLEDLGAFNHRGTGVVYAVEKSLDGDELAKVNPNKSES